MKHVIIDGCQYDITEQPVSDHAPSEAVACTVNGVEKDLSYTPSSGDNISWILQNSPEGLEILRHDTAHVLAQALKDIYGDKVMIAIGPTIKDGFYYDLLCETPLSVNDLNRIEKKMHNIVKHGVSFERFELDRDSALKLFQDKKEKFKVEIINEIPKTETLSLYKQGNFVDLCRGPHAPSTKYIGRHFKLLRIAGAYWRGDSKNVMLQRIYGTAWNSQEELDTYIHNLEEAKKRDHRTLGPKADLFLLNPIAKGSVFWLPNGWFVFREIQKFLREKLDQQHYQEVNTPLFYDKLLWEQSGHHAKFSDCMYMLEQHGDESPCSLKPMNCPAHITLFNSKPRTYKELPLRFSEFGSCARYEPSGALFGIMRLRQFTQDDAHIFCTPEQVQSEARNFCELLFNVYKAFGFTDITIFISTKPENALGPAELWEQAEAQLIDTIKSLGIPFQINEGEGAFYGPKIEFVLKDALQRSWQCGTLQLDYVLPERLGATYVDAHNNSCTPILLHRAILGSIERFLAILIEDRKGILPTWLAPHQVAILTISQEINAYAEKCTAELKAAGIRVLHDDRNKSIGFKVRSAIDKRIPYIISIGKDEADTETVSLKILGKDAKGERLSFLDFKNLLLKDCIITQ